MPCSVISGSGTTAPLNVDLKGAGHDKGLTYVPLGTDVLAIKTGTVIKISKLYSSDYSIMIAAKNDQKNIWEVEHVIEVKVKEGDQVKAGQPIAKVGDFDERYIPRIGLVKFGLLINSVGPPAHVCPFTKIAVSVSVKG